MIEFELYELHFWTPPGSYYVVIVLDLVIFQKDLDVIHLRIGRN